MLYRPGIKPLTSLERFSKTSTSISVETQRNGLVKPQKAQLPTVCVSRFCGKGYLCTSKYNRPPGMGGSVMRINTLTTRCVMVGVMQNRGLLWSTTSLILMPLSSQSTLQDQFLPKGNVVCVHKDHYDRSQGH